jgi:hypothetical protein
MAEHVRTLEAEKAAAILEVALKSHPKGQDLTIADAAAKAGIALREAELGLHHLSSKYRGTLSATDKGELLFRFPYGFSLPFTKKPGVIRFFEKAKKTLLGVGKFAVRAWISIVLVGYVGVFLAVLLALMFSGRSEDRGSSNLGGLAYVLIRVISEALYWTFHPFSPFAVTTWDGRSTYSDRWGRKVKREEKAPFYERVNRFVFGPTEEKPDAREMERRIVAQIRASQGRIGILDVMRVTGLPREEADPLMARLMLDYEGEVEVSDDGGIFYKFPALRRTAQQTAFERPPPPVWTEKVKAPAITGNDGGSNFLISALNGFNLLMSLVALKANLTIERLAYLLSHMRDVVPAPPLPYDGIPFVLGVIPFVFSTLLFALPVYRWATQASREKKAAEENARRAILKTVIEAQKPAGDGEVKGGVTEGQLKKAWREATGSEPDDKKIREEVVALGGDIDLDAVSEGERVQYRFRDLEAEVAALQKERAQASEVEREAGEVVYRS